MNKEFLPFELAVKLKALGFDEPCFSSYDKSGNLVRALWQEIECSTPTFSQAFRWFREKYNLPSNLELLEGGWDYVIYSDIKEEINYGDGLFQTYEEAELACLEKLIEIVEQDEN